MNSPRTSVLKRGTSCRKSKIDHNNLEPLQGSEQVSIVNQQEIAYNLPIEYQNRWSWMTLNGVMSVILRYYTQSVTFES